MIIKKPFECTGFVAEDLCDKDNVYIKTIRVPCGYGLLSPVINRKHRKHRLLYKCPRCGKSYNPQQIDKMMLGDLRE